MADAVKDTNEKETMTDVGAEFFNKPQITNNHQQTSNKSIDSQSQGQRQVRRPVRKQITEPEQSQNGSQKSSEQLTGKKSATQSQFKQSSEKLMPQR